MELLLEQTKDCAKGLYPFRDEIVYFSDIKTKSVIKTLIPEHSISENVQKYLDALKSITQDIENAKGIITSNVAPFYEPIKRAANEKAPSVKQSPSTSRPQQLTIAKNFSDMAISSETYRGERHHDYEEHREDPRIELVKASVISRLSIIEKLSLKKMLGIGMMTDISLTTKQDLFDQRVRLHRLLEFGLSITDIAALWDIRTMEDLKNLDFTPEDLKMEKFYSSFSRSHYGITYDMLVAKYHVDLHFFASDEFTAGDLINYEFPMFPLLRGELKIKMNRELFMKFNVRYQEWKTHFGLTKNDFKALGITNVDAIRMGWGQESIGDVEITKRLEVDNKGKKVMLAYWSMEDYPDLDYDADDDDKQTNDNQSPKIDDQAKKAGVPKAPTPKKSQPLSFGEVLNKKFAKK